MKKRVLAALLCTSLTAGALAGCGSFGGKETAAGTKAPETAGTEGSAGTETAADKEPVELTIPKEDISQGDTPESLILSGFPGFLLGSNTYQYDSRLWYI